MITVTYTDDQNYNEPNTTVCDVALFDKGYCILINYDKELKEHTLEKIKIKQIVFIMETLK